MRARRAAAALLLAAALPALAGCVGLPDDGPVVEVEEPGEAGGDTGGAAAIDARPPQAGQSPTEVVKGFLDAMQAWPTELATAKQYLSSEARTSWNPRGTLVYEDSLPPSGGPATVEVRLGGVSRLDARGAWQGRVSGAGTTLQLGLVAEDGEYRIDTLPDVLVVPEAWFEQRYRQVSVHFLDRTGSVLVPEPVFVGDDSTFATTLVSALLRGPEPDLDRVEQSLLPDGLKVDLSVPVTDGTAAVSLVGEATALTPDDTERMLAQVAWTLRQDPDIDAFTLDLDGRPVRTADGSTRIPVTVGDRLDPAGFQAGPLLYALRDGLLVSGTAGAFDPVDGVLGRVPLGLRSVSVDLVGSTVAGVSEAGGTVSLAPLTDGLAPAAEDGGDEGEDPGLAAVTTVLSGTDVLPPAWDLLDRLWMVDRTATGAVVTWARDERTETVTVPGVTGRDVRHVLVSRDGTRLVAVVRTGGRDEVRVARIRSDTEGVVTGAGRARPLSLGEETSARILDVAWTTTTTLGVLNRLTDDSAKVVTIGVDGAPLGLDAITTTLSGATGLVGSPDPALRVYAVTDTGLADLNADVRGPRVLEEGVTYVGYAG